MTALVELDTKGGKQQVRIFSLRGCHLLAMFARTPVAKEFRKWVLDVIDQHLSENTPYGLKQLPEPPVITKAQQGELFTMVSNKARSSGKPNAYFWSRYQNHFKLASYKDTPADKFEDAKDYLRRLEGNDSDQFMMLTPQELSDIIRDNLLKSKDGELISRESHNSITLSLKPLEDGKTRRWLITQMRGELITIVPLTNEEVMTPAQFVRHLKHDDYIVVKRDEISIGNLVLEQMPAQLLPLMVEMAGKRLNSIRLAQAKD
jgi:hypothetical protein